MDTSNPSRVGTIQHEEIVESVKFDSSESEKANLHAGWIDFFIVSNRKFRMRYDSLTDSMIIEYTDHGKWIKNTTLEIRDQFETEFDCNHDGYEDLYSQYGNEEFVSYYLPAKGLFSRQYRKPADGEMLLDSSNKIYINYSAPFHICNDYTSQLLDYKNTVPTIHYLLTGETYRINGECIIDSINMLSLYKYDSLKDTWHLVKKLKSKTPKDFGYVDFWKKNYKKLMGNQ